MVLASISLVGILVVIGIVAGAIWIFQRLR
jgi:hypothetical protein